MASIQLVKVRDAVKPLGFDNEQQLYRVIREGQFAVPGAILRFGKQLRINLAAVEEATRPQDTAAQKAAA